MQYTWIKHSAWFAATGNCNQMVMKTLYPYFPKSGRWRRR